MTGMESVLAAHVATTHNISGNTDGGHQSRRCQCGSEVTAHYSEMFDDADDLRLYLNAKFAAHVAEALTAAGFGNLHDAWADTISRVEVIDDTGRAYTKYTPAGTVSIDRQDQGRTLKVFITEGATKKVSET